MSSTSQISRAVRRSVYFRLHSSIRIPIARYYERLVAEDPYSAPILVRRGALRRLLAHCSRNVPYYSDLISRVQGSYDHEPERFLQELPILTRSTLRREFRRLVSTDIARRRWRYNTTGGSTGEPVKVIQDADFLAWTTATTILNNEWLGREFGERAVYIWGSERDVLQGSRGLKMNFLNWLTSDEWLNAFQLTPTRMYAFLQTLNSRPPKLIVAYAQAVYELARFAVREGISLVQQNAIMTSAGTLYPFMRESVERSFGCEVFDKYGSRELGNIAWECQQHRGLHGFPCGSYLEIVDDDGVPVPNGTEGNVLVTCLTNFTMPLVRYAIGDRAVLSVSSECDCGRRSQILERVLGRRVDTFRAADGTLVDGEYFTHLLYFRDWVEKFQVIQRDYSDVIFRIIATRRAPRVELDEIVRGTRAALGEQCHVDFEFTDDIPTSGSGKYRYTLSQVSDRAAADEASRGQPVIPPERD